MSMIKKIIVDNRGVEAEQTASSSSQALVLGTLSGTHQVAGRMATTKGPRSRAAGKPTPRASSVAKGQPVNGKPSTCNFGRSLADCVEEEGPTKPKTVCNQPAAEEATQAETKLREAIRREWADYRAYHQVVFSLTAKGAGLRKAASLEVLEELNPTCFWRALFFCYRECDLLAFWSLVTMPSSRVHEPVDVVRAVEIVRQAGLNVKVAWHNISDGTVEVLHESRGKMKFLPGLLHVIGNDQQAMAPHWLPYASEKPGASYKLSRRVRRQIDARLGKKVPVGSGPRYEVESESDTLTVSNPYDCLEEDPYAEWDEEPDVDDPAVSSDCSSRHEDEPVPGAPAPQDDPTGVSQVESQELKVDKGPQQSPAPTPPKSPAVADAAPPSAGRRAAKPHVPPPPPPPQPVAGALRDADIPFFSVAYGWTPPPCPTVFNKKRALRSVRTRWHEAKSEESSLHAVRAAEGLLTRCWLGRFYAKILVEARKEVLMKRRLAPGDWLYERVLSDHGVNDNLDATGAIQLRRLETIECDGLVLKKGPVHSYVDGDRRYLMCELVTHDTYGCNCLTLLGWARRPVERLGLVTQEMPELALRELQNLPDDDSRIRTVYALMKPLLTEEVKGPMNDIRNVHLSIKEKADFEPIRVAKDVMALDKAMRARLMHVPAFANASKRNPKSCVSCGTMPPKKYRWKHRICEQCRAKLNTRGYVTPAGCQVQMNLHVGTCYPGLVYVQPEQFPPTEKKWKLVDPGPTPCTEVQIDRHVALVKQSRDNAPKLWCTVQKTVPPGEQVGGVIGMDDLMKRLSLPVPEGYSHCLAGIACSGARPMVSAKTPYNSVKALLGRVFLQPPANEWGEGPKPGIWPHMRTFVDELLPDFTAERMTFEAWLETMPRHRRPALLRAWQRLERTGWLKSMAAFSCFVKLEFLPGFGKVDGDLRRLMTMLDRLINGPADETHCIAGPILKPLVSRLKEIWHAEAPIFYGSAGPEKLHKFLQVLVAEESQYFWCDFSMFDRTHSMDSWAFMESLYDRSDPLFRTVLDAWRAPRGRIGPVRFKAPVINASGRDDTALANGVLNGFATYISACASWLRKEVEDMSVGDLRSCYGSIRLSVCGDDSLGRIPLCSEERMVEFRDHFNRQITKFGFVAKLQTSTNILQAVYLGMRPYPTEKGWFWGKTIGRASYKMGWVMLKEGRDPMAHMTGIADLHVQCSSHVPVLGDLAKKIVELRQGARRTPVELDSNKPWEWTYKSGVRYSRITLQAVADVYSARSTPGCPVEWEREVTVEDVEDLIREINGIERLPAVVDHWLWKHMVYADDL